METHKIKKLVIAVSVLAGGLSGCAATPAPVSQVSDTTSDVSQPIADTSAETTAAVSVSDFDSVPLKTITSAQEIEYKFNNPNNSDFGELSAFSHGKVLFTKDKDRKEDASTGGGGASAELQVFLYDMAGNKADYISEYIFENYGALSSLYMSDRYYIYATGSRNPNSTVIYITDTKDKTTSVLAEVPGHFPTFSQYSENELLYFYYYSKDDKYYQYVKLYNVKTGETKTLSENITDDADSAEVLAANIHNGEIYVLYREVKDDKLDTYINVYDTNGNVIKSIRDIDLGNRDKVEDEYACVTLLYVYDDTVFIRVSSEYGYYLFGFQYDPNDETRLIRFYGRDTADKNLYTEDSTGEIPLTAANDKNLLYLMVYSGSRELMLFDLTTKKAARFNFDIDGYNKLLGVVADEKGDVVFSLCVDEYGAGRDIRYFYLSLQQLEDLREN